VGLTLLVILQLYQTCTNSWVAVHYNSHRTEMVKTAIDALPKNGQFFVYQAPELVLFLPSNNYYQYLEVTKTITIGYNTLTKLKDGTASFVLTSEQEWKENQSLFAKYHLKTTAERYVILEKTT
jgi:hypothetical protein